MFELNDKQLYEVYERHRAEVDAEALRQGRTEPWIVERRAELIARGWW